MTQAFIATMFMVGWLVALEVEERERAADARDTANREKFVAERLRAIEAGERRRIEALQALTARLGAALTPEAIGHCIAAAAPTVFGASALALGAVDEAARRLEWLTITGFPPDIEAVFATVRLDQSSGATDSIRTRRPVFVRSRDEYRARYPVRASWIESPGVGDWVYWPLLAGGRCVGTLGLLWGERQVFDDSQLAYIATAADLVTQALIRARAYVDEHAIATVLQRAVTPSLANVRIGGFVVGACYRPAQYDAASVGGDWYDSLALAEGGAFFAVGDVVGHGIGAVEDMTQLRNAGRTLAIEGHAPGRLLAELTRVTALGTTGKFATIAVVLIEAHEPQFRYATAGHPPVLVRRASGVVEMLARRGGPPLGTSDDAVYDEGVAPIAPRDIILLYSDGLIEARGKTLDDGLERLCDALAAWPLDPDREHLNDLCEYLVLRAAPSPQRDDICVLAVMATDGRASLGPGYSSVS